MTRDEKLRIARQLERLKVDRLDLYLLHWEGHVPLEETVEAFGGKVFAAVSSKSKEDIVREAGADAIIDLSVPDLHEGLRQQVFALTGKKGVNIIVDMLGGDIFDAAVRALAWCGRLIVIGFASGRIPSLKMNYVLVKNIEVSGAMPALFMSWRGNRATRVSNTVSAPGVMRNSNAPETERLSSSACSTPSAPAHTPSQ